MRPDQVADYNGAVAAVLDIFERLGDVVIVAPPPPGIGWNGPQQVRDVYERVEFALHKLAVLEPARLTQQHRQRVGSLDDNQRSQHKAW